MDPLILISIVPIVMAAVAVLLTLWLFRFNRELRQSDADRAAQSRELEHVKAQLEDATKDANAVQELRVEVGRLESDLAATKDVAERANESNEKLESRRDELQGQVRELTARESGLREQLKGANDALAVTNTRNGELESELEHQRQRSEEISIREGGLRKQLDAVREQLAERDDFVKQAKDSFKVLSTQTLEQQQKSFMQTADANLKEREAAVKKLVDPLTQKVDALERARERGQGMLQQQIETLMKSNGELSNQAKTLSSALTYKPQVRGQWGEMQVERVLELAGLVKGIHYETQATDASGQRPDFVVHMPHNRDIILDSKVSLNAYMDYQHATTDADGEECLQRHAKNMKSHADQLGNKRYGVTSQSAADYVVMVVPDFALQPATERDPQLIDRSAENQVVICGYSTLHALLKCVAMGWQERHIAEEALEVANLGRELHDRIETFSAHLAGVGKGLDNAITRYNESVGSFDTRVVPQARRFKELGVRSTKEIKDVQTVDKVARTSRNAITDGDSRSILAAFPGEVTGSDFAERGEAFEPDDHSARAALI